jgi:hypothetical protein
MQSTTNAITGSAQNHRAIFRIGGFASIAMLVIIALQIGIYVAWPPPESTEGFIALLNQNSLLGLLSLDFLYLINNAILVLIYLPIYLVLRERESSWTLIALILGLVGIAAYFASNTSFEMLAVSRQFAAAGSEAEKTALLGAAEAFLAIYKGTAFNVYYVLNAVTLLIFANVILKKKAFTKAAGIAGLISGVLMSIPSSAGTIGMIFALASLIPWAVFLILLIPAFFRMGATE